MHDTVGQKADRMARTAIVAAEHPVVESAQASAFLGESRERQDEGCGVDYGGGLVARPFGVEDNAPRFCRPRTCPASAHRETMGLCERSRRTPRNRRQAARLVAHCDGAAPAQVMTRRTRTLRTFCIFVTPAIPRSHSAVELEAGLPISHLLLPAIRAVDKAIARLKVPFVDSATPVLSPSVGM